MNDFELERIVVETPPSDSSRHRIEPHVFDRLDAIRSAERAGELAPDRRGRARWPKLAIGGLAVAMIALVVVRMSPEHPPPAAVSSSPSLVVTPTGGSSRFTIDDAVIDAGSDTSVEVKSGDDGAVTLVLARGTIDCDVAPRNGRPFHVIAGDIVVEVVGTRFTVSRAPAVRVDVTHGKVRVRSPDGEWLVGSGDRWPAASLPRGEPAGDRSPAALPSTASEHVAAAAGAGSGELAPVIVKRTAISPRGAYLAAQRLEVRDWLGTTRSYRTIANGDDQWAALALYSLAELDATHDRQQETLALLDEYHRRFPRGASAEDAAWLRVDILRGLGRADDARAAAADYLRRFPGGTYKKPATRLATPP